MFSCTSTTATSMSYVALFRHRWLTPVSNGPDATKTVRLGGMLLLMIAALCAGALTEDWVREIRPAADPLRWINGWLLPLGALYVIGRGYQGTPGMRPYLSLPFSRIGLVRFGVAHALLHPVNVGVFAFGIAFWGRTVVPAHSWTASAAYGGGLLLGLGTATHLACLFGQVLAKRPLRVVLLLAGGGLVFSIGTKTGLIPVFGLSERLFGGLLEGRAVPGVLLLGSYLGSLGLHRRQLWRRLYLDDGRDDANRSSGGAEVERQTTTETGAGGADAVRAGTISRWIDRLVPVSREGTVAALVAIEWRLVSRNRQPRRLAVALVFPVFVALLAGAGAGGGISIPYEPTLLLLWGVAVGGWVLDYGSKILSWEGRRLEGVLTRAVRPQDLAWAKLGTLLGGTLVLWTFPLPVVLFAGTSFIGVHAAFLVYVLGWGVPVVLVAAVFNGTPVDLNDRSFFTASELGVGRIAASVLLLGPAVGVFVWADTALVFAGGLAALGVLSALCIPLWVSVLRRAWDRRYPAILEDFREGGR